MIVCVYNPSTWKAESEKESGIQGLPWGNKEIGSTQAIFCFLRQDSHYVAVLEFTMWNRLS